ncbi:ScyD/ScyE family protein [Massilia sp. IC2-278]|uniref:ScyD/ScyE family protein n=1 Tax=Massilia sp. IC2-278 TaxID=2887200 RepID=UPI001E467726|nr:ScyD/ScyE family protein [Massilia sp. IC2-278]MCC2962669.1 ScyD/ScyE family protein [Massilia sp. IC2-278]
MKRLSFMLATLAATSALHAAPQVEVVATGLNNPRGLAFAPNGQLFVAEAGSGGNGRCLVLADGRTACYGETGALTRVDPRGVNPPKRIITGLPSVAGQPDGFGGTGPQNIAFSRDGRAALAMGLGADAPARNGVGRKAWLFGKVLQLSLHGGPVLAAADIATYEFTHNPVPGGADSNPNGVALASGQTVVADAGANAVFGIAANRSITTLAAFPPRLVPAPPSLALPPGATIPMQSVPTTVVDGRDGWLYVGELTGFPFPVGGANVYRMAPDGTLLQTYASGFTNIVALAFDSWQRLYVLEIGNGPSFGAPPLRPPGRLIRVNPDGSRTVVYDQLFYPGGLAIGEDNAAYVTNNGVVPGPIPGGQFAAGGTVLRIRLD